MKLIVEHDETGMLTAVMLLSPDSERGNGSAPRRCPGRRHTQVNLPSAMAKLAPQLGAGTSLAEKHVHPLRTLIAQFRLDTTQKGPKLVRK